MTYSDRLVRGFIAGIAGGISMSILDLILTSFGWVKHPYYDWILTLVSGTAARSSLEVVLGLISHLMFAGILGIIFAYSILVVSSKNILLRGWIFSIVVWFAVHILVNLFGFQQLRPIPTSQLISDFSTASVFGLVLAWTLNRLTPKEVK